MSVPPLRRNRDFVLLQAGQALSTIACFGLALVSTLSPSIRDSPSLDELDDLPATPSASLGEAG